MDGFLFLNKAKGITSRTACDDVSKFFNENKVGHVGTLDPFATGLLIISLGKGTKAGTFFDNFAKRYIATIKLGEESETGDTEGKIIKTLPIPVLDENKITEVLNSFLGKSMQIPPMTSAVHVNGKKLYELAHKGQVIDRPSREIEIFDIKLLSIDKDVLKIDVKVSKGTYIRVLGEDIAKRLGTCGYLTDLVRTELGPFKLEEASQKVYSVGEVLARFSEVKIVDEKMELDIKNGKYKYFSLDSGYDKLLIMNTKKEAVAMYTKNEEGKFVFARGLF